MLMGFWFGFDSSCTEVEGGVVRWINIFGYLQ